MANDATELVLNRTWRPRLAVIGANGMPHPKSAGSVLLPFTTLKLDLRLPPASIVPARARRSKLCSKETRLMARLSSS